MFLDRIKPQTGNNFLIDALFCKNDLQKIINTLFLYKQKVYKKGGF